MATLLTLEPFQSTLEVRPLPSTGITRLPRYYEPVRHPTRPSLSLAGVRLGHVSHRWGFPCCVRSPCADMPSPLPRRDRRLGSGCSPGSDDGGLPQMSAGSAPASTFSRPARRSLTLWPACSRSRLATLCIEGSGSFVTSATAPIATGWSNSCQVGIAPTEERHLCTAHGHTRFFFTAIASKKSVTEKGPAL